MAEIDAYRELAMAVLLSAIRDARGKSPHRASARTFLAGGPALEFWTSVAGIEASALRPRRRR